MPASPLPPSRPDARGPGSATGEQRPGPLGTAPGAPVTAPTGGPSPVSTWTPRPEGEWPRAWVDRKQPPPAFTVGSTGGGDPSGPPSGPPRDRPERGGEDPGEHRERSLLATVLLVALSMLVVSGLALGGFAVYLNHLMDSNVRRESLLPQDGRGVRGADSALNILVLGSDTDPALPRRSDASQEAGRADVVQLVHILRDRSAVEVIHLPGNLVADVPGRGRSTVAMAFGAGGAPLLVQTVERMLGVRVDHVAAVGFDGFRELTDTVGGVDIHVSTSSANGRHRFTPGTMHMDGETALAFVRQHQAQNGVADAGAGERQEAWTRALLAKSASAGSLANPATLASMIGDTSRNLVVDEEFSTSRMRDLAWSLKDVRGGDIRFRTAPVPPLTD